MTNCDGTERHRHYKIDTATYITHTHRHEIYDEDFSLLHHHSPFEHVYFTREEMEGSMINTGKGPDYNEQQQRLANYLKDT